MNNTGANHAQNIQSGRISTILDAPDLVEDYDEARDNAKACAVRAAAYREKQKNERGIAAYEEVKTLLLDMTETMSLGRA